MYTDMKISYRKRKVSVKIEKCFLFIVLLYMAMEML